jgi:hypothetical protein
MKIEQTTSTPRITEFVPALGRACTTPIEARFDINSSPFCAEGIRAAAKSMHGELELSALRAQLEASERAVVELFAGLAQAAPEMLPPQWALVYDILAAEERLWVYPKMTLGEIEEGTFDAFTPYLDRCKLLSEWHSLLEHAQSLLASQTSAKRHSLTA